MKATELSRKTIQALIGKLMDIDRDSGWTDEESKEFDRLMALHPEETEEDEQYLSWMSEGSFLKHKINP